MFKVLRLIVPLTLAFASGLVFAMNYGENDRESDNVDDRRPDLMTCAFEHGLAQECIGELLASQIAMPWTSPNGPQGYQAGVESARTYISETQKRIDQTLHRCEGIYKQAVSTCSHAQTHAQDGGDLQTAKSARDYLNLLHSSMARAADRIREARIMMREFRGSVQSIGDASGGPASTD